MPKQDAAIAYAKQHQDRFLEDLKAFLRIPSVSNLPEHKADMQRAAEWIGGQLKEYGFQRVQVMPTKGHPVLYAEMLTVGKNTPTVLFYGHYDVQPTDPIDEWISGPFEPEVRGECIYARGASDMKSQLIAFLKAVESMVHTTGLPFNLKMMIEGEEETGSPSMKAFLAENKDLLSCDFCLNGDSGLLAADTPSITYGLRGLAYFEIRVRGPATDLHSGRFGGVVDNPAIVLCEVIAGMRDAQGHIMLPGFYDHVRPLSKEERQELARLPTPDKWWQDQTGASALHGEKGYTATERALARPTLDVNGFYSGFIAPGTKTVLPARAMAKVSMRLVPDQTPEEVHASLHKYLVEHMPGTVSWEMELLNEALPGIVQRDSVAVRAASAALENVWGKKPLFTREGGSIPVVGLIQKVLGVDTLMLGFGLPDDNLHAPNEKQHLPTLVRGIETFIRFGYGIGA